MATDHQEAYETQDLVQQVYDLIRPRMPVVNLSEDIAADLAGRQRKIRKLQAELKAVAAANRKLKQERKGWGKVAAELHSVRQKASSYSHRIDSDAQIIVDLTRENDALRRELETKS